MEPLSWLLAALGGALVLLVLALWKRGPQNTSDAVQPEEGEHEEEEQQQQPGERQRTIPRGRSGRARLIEARRRAERDDVDFDEDPPETLVDKTIKVNYGTKKLRKMEAKEERKAQREQEVAAREDKREREELRREYAKKKEEEEEAKKLEEEEKARLEKLRQEEEEQKEYDQFKQFFSVDTEGSGETDIQQESDTLLQDFINHIKTQKVVLLEDLAVQFNLKTQDAINRIRALEELGRLSGIVDDRGKFIYISEEELREVAKFIKQRGRVSISELAESSNSLIELQPSY
eukprot:m.16174 g.16174  ORF g.16174 m.16174 type:complete len:290 (+) comp26769_c0_seq1:465-1334(+)